MIPEGSTAVALPADQTASVEWFVVFYKDMEIACIPIVVSPLMAPGVIQVVLMRNGRLEVKDAIYARGGP